jgi:hypothetical protein
MRNIRGVGRKIAISVNFRASDKGAIRFTSLYRTHDGRAM